MQELDYFRDFEQTMSEFKAHCTGAEHPKVIIDTALRSIVQFYSADRAYITENDWDLEVSHNSHEYCRSGVTPHIYDNQYISLQGFDRWRKAHESGKSIIIPSIEQFADMPQIYGILRENGVFAMLLSPLSKRISGNLGVDNPRRYSGRPHLLELMSYVVANEIAELRIFERPQVQTSDGTSLKPNEIIINLLGSIELLGPRGMLTEEQIFSKNCCRLIGYMLLNRHPE
jgi:GAF domain-containing protein